MKYLILMLFFAGNVYAQECVDSDGDGWGWDGSGSCRVTATIVDACDYSNAGASDGWGWNPVSGTSCPPVTDVVLTGLSAEIVGEWFCRQETFDGQKWDSFSDNTWRMIFNSDGSAASQDIVDQNNAPGFVAPILSLTWRLDGFDFYLSGQKMAQIGFFNRSWAYYHDDLNRRICGR